MRPFCPTLTPSWLADEHPRRAARAVALRRGEADHLAGRFVQLCLDEEEISAIVIGGGGPYRVRLAPDYGGTCECPSYDSGEYCRHLCGLWFAASAATSPAVPEPAPAPAAVSRRALSGLLRAEQIIRPELAERLDRHAAGAAELLENAEQATRRIQRILERDDAAIDGGSRRPGLPERVGAIREAVVAVVDLSVVGAPETAGLAARLIRTVPLALWGDEWDDLGWQTHPDSVDPELEGWATSTLLRALRSWLAGIAPLDERTRALLGLLEQGLWPALGLDADDPGTLLGAEGVRQLGARIAAEPQLLEQPQLIGAVLAGAHGPELVAALGWDPLPATVLIPAAERALGAGDENRARELIEQALTRGWRTHEQDFRLRELLGQLGETEAAFELALAELEASWPPRAELLAPLAHDAAAVSDGRRRMDEAIESARVRIAGVERPRRRNDGWDDEAARMLGFLAAAGHAAEAWGTLDRWGLSRTRVGLALADMSGDALPERQLEVLRPEIVAILKQTRRREYRWAARQLVRIEAALDAAGSPKAGSLTRTLRRDYDRRPAFWRVVEEMLP